MSDLSLQLLCAHSPLSVRNYFDEALFLAEQKNIFQKSPCYVGHRLAAPEAGDYYALPHEGEGRALVHTAKGIELISNVCRHRQAVILKGRGRLGAQGDSNIVCPLHRWTYDLHGQLIGAPHFEHDPCLNLHNYPLREWNGLLFEDNGCAVESDLKGVGSLHELDFDGYVLDRVVQHDCNYNWKTFIEVYLEDYHVGPFHPGLGSFVTCDDLQWELKENYSIQTVGLGNVMTQGSLQSDMGNRLGHAGSPVYQRWQKALLRYQQEHHGGAQPAHGAIWFTYYPHIMVEWYPHVLTVSTLHPQGPQKTLNTVEFYYPQDIQAFEREFVEAQQAAYMETCIEDDEIAERMDAGRLALMRRGDDESGPYQSPMEDGMQHFHEWYEKRMRVA